MNCRHSVDLGAGCLDWVGICTGKSGTSLSFLRLLNSSLTLGGLFCCDLYRMTLVVGFVTVG